MTCDLDPYVLIQWLKGHTGGRRAHLLFYVRVGGSQQPVDLWRQISAHLR